MKKLIVFLAFFLAMGGSAFAQGTLYQLSPPAPNARVLVCPSPDNGYPCPVQAAIFSDVGLTQAIAQPVNLGSGGFFSFYIASGTYVIQLTGPGYNSGNRQVVTIGGSSGGITSVSSLPGTCTVGQEFLIPNGADGQVFVCGPAANTYTSTAAIGGTTDPSSFGAKFNGKACFSNVHTITLANGGTTVTCNTANFCNGTTVACAAGQISDVGKQFTATTNSCCGVNFNFQGILAMANVATTITAVNSATSATISQNFTSACGGNCIIAWATNDDAAITAAEAVWAAQNKCGAMVLPAGITALLQPHWNNPGAACLGMEPQADYTSDVNGQGHGTTVLGLFAGFNSAGCTFGPSNNVCFGAFLESNFRNLQWNGFGWGNTGFATAKILIGPTLGSEWSSVACMAFGGSDTNLTGFAFNGVGVRVWGLSVDGCGNTGASVLGSIAKAYYCFFGDTLGPNLNIGAGGDLLDIGCDYGIAGGTTVIRNDGRYHGVGSNIFSCGSVANITALNMGNGANSVGILDGARFTCLSTTSNGVFLNQATAKLYLVGATHVGGTSSAVLRSAGLVYTDPTTTFDSGAITSLAPACTFTSGGGTTPSCALQAGSTNEKGAIIATTGSGAPGTTGTVTLTFAGTFTGPSGAAPSCIFIPDDSGTAWGNGALTRVSTQSTTAPIVAWSNSAANVLTALTVSVPYRIGYKCEAR